MSVNKITLVGRLTHDAELKTAKNGQSILSFSIATSERFKNDEGKYIDRPEFHRLSAFGERFKGIAPYLAKGTMLYIDGKLCHRTFIDKDNIKSYITDIIVNEIILLSKSQKQEMSQVDENIHADENIWKDTGEVMF